MEKEEKQKRAEVSHSQESKNPRAHSQNCSCPTHVDVDKSRVDGLVELSEPL